ncbi:MAG: transporter substrate-binding protein, partial [bacterium]|nr:transporter substrate-binding protein [bacterium]
MIGGIGVVFVLAICGLAAWSFWDASPPIPQGDPIKVGVLQSLSGTMSTSGTSVIDATLLAIEEINASGGLLGRPVEAVVADGKSNTQTYASEAERLIVEERVSTVFGCWTSASRKTVKPIFEEHDHLLIYPVQYEGMETSPNIIYLGAAPNQQFIPAVNWANESLGKKRFFLVGSDYVFPRAASEVIKDQLKKMDAELVGEVFVPLGSSEFKPVVQEI